MKNLIKIIEKRLNITVIDSSIPPQGMDSYVITIKISNGLEWALKIGNDVKADNTAYELIRQYSDLDIPIPKIIDSFEFDNTFVIVMEKFNYPLMQNIPDNEKHKYIKSMVKTLDKIHKIKSNKEGLLYSLVSTNSWVNLLELILSGNHPWFPWEEILKIDFINSEIIRDTLSNLRDLIEDINDFPNSNYALLHTDFNQRNIFINPNDCTIAGVIDWTEAMFGDPLYDMARVKLYKYHFNVDKNFDNILLNELNLSEKELRRLDFYFILIVLTYLRWYSDDPSDEFNLKRIKLHQEILSRYLVTRVC